jgi:hypothetical protein
MRVSRICSALLIVALLVGGKSPVSAQAEGERYFPETGHWIRGDFLEFYESADDPIVLYGYPITEAFTDARSGLDVQYFQRARFEANQEKDGSQRVQLTPLGSLLYTPGANPQLDISTPLACREFAETGFPVCYGFLEFFDANGGAAQFGNPISGFESYNGRIVQYFERARLEWYPELGASQKVRPADLGRTYFDSIPEDAALLAPVVTSFAPRNQVQQLVVRVFVQKGVARGTDTQQVHILVQDQTRQPVAGASVTLTVLWPGAGSQLATLTTDQSGLAAASIGFNDRQPGEMVIVNATAGFGDLRSSASGSFRIWR